MCNYQDIIIIIALAIIFYIDYIYIDVITSIDDLSITTKDKADINNYLQIISNIFDNHDIKYWIISGTLLGSVRHGDMVPWDDDADIGVLESDINKILGLNEYLKTIGYEIAKSWRIHKFRKIGTEYPFVDIFCFIKEKNKYIMNHIDLIYEWPNEYYLEDELFPLKKYKFGNMYLYGPNYPLKHLDRMYSNWRIVGKQNTDHKTGKRTNITIRLNISNPMHKLKPTLYVSSEADIKAEYDQHYNDKIITLN
jgi:lipopolysaccharide cholinephosphotransferase